jgi:Actinobacteria/chloroflexi VLRF1 release factor
VGRFVGRENVRKRLAPLEGEQGRTVYAGGVVRIEFGGETILVRPPFGLAQEAEYGRVRLAPLFEALVEEHIVAALLVRLGGYAIGVFEGELLAAKLGSRFVKGRHRKGGSSADRFRRRREQQARALIDEAAQSAAQLLEPWRQRVEFVALGGDREATGKVLRARAELGWLSERAIPRFFAVPDPRRRVLERLPYDLYAAELCIE